MTSPVTDGEYAIYEHGPVNVARWCAGDGSDESSALNSAADEARASGRSLYMPEHLTVTINGIVNLRHIEDVNLAGTIRVGPDGRVDTGYRASKRSGARLRIHHIAHVNWQTQTNVALRTVGMKQAEISVGYCDNWQWYADGKVADDSSSSYCTITPGYIKNLSFLCETDAETSTYGWITQLTFVGGDIRFIDATSDGYIMNSVAFINTCLEGGEVRLDYANRWQFRNVRCEYDTEFHFGSNTSRIVVEDSFIQNPGQTTPGAVLVSDQGSENVVTTSFEAQYDRRTLAAIDTSTVILDQGAEIGVTNLDPGITNLNPRGTFLHILDTGLLPIRGESPRFRMTRIEASSETKWFRPYWTFYRSDGSQIEVPDGIRHNGGASWSESRKAYTYLVNVGHSSIAVANNEIAFVRLVIESGNVATPFRSVAVTGFFTGASSDYVVDLCRRRFSAELAQDSTPTKGSPPVGTRVRGAGKDWLVGSRQEMTVSPSTTGDTSITVSSGTNVAVGDVLGLTLGTGATHWATILGISGAGGRILELSSPVPSEVSAGAKAVATRWRSVSG